MKKQMQTIDATPAILDVISGKIEKPTNCPRFGKREWAVKTPAWPHLEKIFGKKLEADGSPDIDESERSAGFSVAFTVWLNKNESILVLMNSDGTRCGYYA